MARNLYRLYLYTVFVAMLIFAVAGLVRFLQTLLELTALRGTYSSAPTSTMLVQTGVFFAVSWLLAGLLGGLHYWLIRRDMQSDPDAGSSAIRAFFLNVTELIAAPLAIGIGANTLTQFGQYSNGADLSFSIAFVIALLGMVGVLEWERRRAQAGAGVAVFFQRLHLYGVQFILLNILVGYWLFAGYQVVDALVFRGGGSGTTPCGGFVVCQGQNILSDVAAVLWVALFWVVYGFAGRLDSASLLRRIAHYISFAYGTGFVLYGIYQLIELAILNIAGVKVLPSDFLSSNNFILSILLGLLIASVYTLWLRSAARQNPVEWHTSVLIGQAIIGILMAAAFYTGVALLLINLMELPVDAHGWADSLSLLITGVGYIPLDIYLHRRKRADDPGAMNARRAFVFFLLGGSILAGVIGGAFALFSAISAALGSPPDNWQHIARSGASAFVVGALIVAVYLWVANREKLFAGLGKRAEKTEPLVTTAQGEQSVTAAQVVEAAQTSPASVAPGTHLTIESVLDDLLAGKISRDQAATHIREIAEVK